MNIKMTRLKICGIKNITQPITFNFCNKTFTKNTDFSDFNIKGIYGENGSGKTACIYSVHILKNILLNRNYLKDESTQKALFEIINKNKKEGFIEVEYYCSFDDTQLIYLLRVDFKFSKTGRFEIVRENLKRKKPTYAQNKYIDVYAVNNGKLEYFCDKERWNYIEEISKNILIEQSLSSIIFDKYIQNTIIQPNDFNKYIQGFLVAVLNTKVYIDKIDNYKNHFYYADLENLYDTSTDTGRNLFANAIMLRHYSQNENYYIVNKTSLESFKRYVIRMGKFVKLFKTDLNDVTIDVKENDENCICSLNLDYEKYSIDLKFESAGIKKLFQIFNYLEACSNGYIVFIDELDTSINSIYLNKILEYMSRFGDGQLCFTAHNLSTMSVIKDKKKSIDFLSSINTVHTWSKDGNLDPESVYRKGFIEDSPYNIEAEDYIGIFGG